MQDEQRARLLTEEATLVEDREARSNLLRQALDLEVRASLDYGMLDLERTTFTQSANDAIGHSNVTNGDLGFEELARPPLPATSNGTAASLDQPISTPSQSKVIDLPVASPPIGDLLAKNALPSGISVKAKTVAVTPPSTKARPLGPRTPETPKSQLASPSSSSILSRSSIESETGKRRPKKLQIRSVKQELPLPAKRKPKKLEVRAKT